MERALAHAHAVADDDALVEQWEQRAEMERAIAELTEKMRRLDEAIAERPGLAGRGEAWHGRARRGKGTTARRRLNAGDGH